MFENYYIEREIRKAKRKRRECEWWIKAINKLEGELE